MSRSRNKVELLGYVGQDPEVRTTATGAKVATLSLATTKTWKNGEGEKQEKTEWHRIVAWGKLADVVNSYVRKGSQILVDGELAYGKWTDKEGQTRYTTEINVRELLLMGGTGDRAESGKGKKPAAESERSFDDFPEEPAEDDDLPF